MAQCWLYSRAIETRIDGNQRRTRNKFDYGAEVRLAAAFRLFREAELTDEEWKATCNSITDQMKVFTRPYVTILAGPPGKPADIGTGTFIEKD